MPAFALSTATKGNAKIAGLGTLGTIEAGKCADMIVCQKNPLESLDALRQLDMVITRGQRIDAPKVKKMEQVERELDRFL
jgi:imidazolonepropionase-like amidohydrolase